jgi:NADPH:quinone reductase-like Zn-dependent oxidoreductase
MAMNGRELRSLVTENGELELSIAQVSIMDPGEEEVLVRVDATPINPSDIGLLFGVADMSAAKFSGSAQNPVVTAPIPDSYRRAMASRQGKALTVGNEGAGVVIKAGAKVRHLMGKTVAMFGGGMYAQYRTIPASNCIELPSGTTAAEGASCFVNPLSALGMIETMRREGHSALVHTAAASNLGQMLNRVCLADDVPLVNIVRSSTQVHILREIGARYVCDSSRPEFLDELIDMLADTGATLAFDAIGGGKLASQILTAMEAVASRSAKEYTRYGSSIHKQIYIYGGLNSGPTELSRSYGMLWGVGGWLLTPLLEKIGPAETERLRQRVVREIKTTFVSHYSKVVSLAGALAPDAIATYNRRSTGEKFLINPGLS